MTQQYAVPLIPARGVPAKIVSGAGYTDLAWRGSFRAVHFLFQAEDGIRDLTVTGVQTCALPISRAGLVAALGAGDRSLIPPEVEEDLAASGLVHLLASSGLHLAVVALLVRWAAKRLWLRGPWAGRARAAAVASLCAAPAIAAEVLLLGAPWPAVRAGIGAGLALSADLCGRRADGLTALFAAAPACALLDPAATHDLALQLSVAGVAGMLVLADPLRDFLPRPLPLMPRPRRLSPIPRRPAEHALRLAC